MTLGTPDRDPPVDDGGLSDDESASSAERQDSAEVDHASQVERVSRLSGQDAEQPSQSAEQQNLIGLTFKILNSWPHVRRTAFLLAVLVSLVGALMWAVPMDIQIGELVRISPH
jgi:hypothetical protein